MAITVTARGTGTHNTSSATLVVTPTSDFTNDTTGRVVAVLVVAYDNSGGSGADPYSSISADSNGNTWVSRVASLNDPGAASAGVAGRIFTAIMSAGRLTTASTITINFGTNATAKAWNLWEVLADSPNQPVYVTGNQETAATAAPTITSTSIASGDVIIGAVGAEAGTTQTFTDDADASSGNWSTSQYAEVGSTTSGQTVGSQYKVVTATATQTYNPTLGISSDVVEMWVQISQTGRRAFSQAQAKINAFGVKGYAQAQAKLNAFNVEEFGQAQAQIKQTYNSFAQARANIKQTYNLFGQAQASIYRVDTFPFGRTTVTDNFNRANENPIAGRWNTTVNYLDTPAVVESNKLGFPTGGGEPTGTDWGVTIPHGFEATIEIVDAAVAPNSYFLLVRTTNSYAGIISEGSVISMAAHQDSPLLNYSKIATIALTTGDTLGIRRVKDRVETWYKLAAGAWTFLAVAPSNIDLTGNATISIEALVDSGTLFLDNFRLDPLFTGIAQAQAVIRKDDTYANSVKSDLALAHYRLGESSGATMTDETGTHNGLYVGTVGYGTEGAVAGNTAITLDGSGTDYGEVAAWTTMPSTTVSIEAWIKHDGSTFGIDATGITIAGWSNTGSGDSAALMAWPIDADSIELGFYTDTGNANYNWTPAGDTNWHHIVGVVNNANNPEFYFDGILQGTGATSYVGGASTQPFRIGAGDDDGAIDGSWPGSIDEVAVYGQALDSTRISTHYSFKVTPNFKKFAQAQASIKQTYNSFAQAQASIKQTYNSFAQAQAQIKQTYNSFAQAQVRILRTYTTYAQAQAQIKQVYNSFAQAQSNIKQTYNSFAQAQASIKQTYNGFAQAQASIKQTYNAFAQAQASILAVSNGFAQAQASIQAYDIESFAQAQGRIVTSYQVCAQAQAFIIFKVSSRAQSVALIAGDFFPPVIDTFTRTVSDGLGTADNGDTWVLRAGTASNSDVTGSVATILTGPSTTSVWELRRTLLSYFDNQGFEFSFDVAVDKLPATANIDINLGMGISGLVGTYNAFVQFRITPTTTRINIGTATGSQSADLGVAYTANDIYRVKGQVIKSSGVGFAYAKAWKLSNPEPGWHVSTLTTGALNVTASIPKIVIPNISDANSPFLITIDNINIQTANITQYSQAQASIKQTYNSFAQAQADILTTSNVFSQAQAQIIAFDVEAFAQSQTQIKQTYLGFAQAQSAIKTTYNSFAQAQATILIVNNGYAQAQAQITAIDITGFAEAQAFIAFDRVYDSFNRSESDPDLGTADVGGPYIVESHTGVVSVSSRVQYEHDAGEITEHRLVTARVGLKGVHIAFDIQEGNLPFVDLEESAFLVHLGPGYYITFAMTSTPQMQLQTSFSGTHASLVATTDLVSVDVWIYPVSNGKIRVISEINGVVEENEYTGSITTLEAPKIAVYNNDTSPTYILLDNLVIEPYAPSGIAQAAALIAGQYGLPFEDTFTRTVTDGLGTSDNGDTWVLHQGNAQNADVDGAQGTLVNSIQLWDLPQTLGLATSRGLQISGTASVNGIPDAAFISFYIGLKNAQNFLSLGAGLFVQDNGGIGTGSFVADSGQHSSTVPYTANDPYHFVAQIIGASGNVDVWRFKFWKVGDTEPDWTESVPAAKIQYPIAQTVRLLSFIDASSNGPFTWTFDNLRIEQADLVALSQAQAVIIKPAGYGQAEAVITRTEGYGQAQATIVGVYDGYSQAGARIGAHGPLYYIKDTFTRTLSNDLGTPDIGPTYTNVSGTFEIDGSKLIIPNNQYVDSDTIIWGQYHDISIDFRIPVEPFGPIDYFQVYLETYHLSQGFVAHEAWVEIDNNDLIVKTDGGNSSFSIGTLEFGVYYTFKLRTAPSYTTAKVWKTLDPEPDWQVFKIYNNPEPVNHLNFYIYSEIFTPDSSAEVHLDNLNITEVVNAHFAQAQALIVRTEQGYAQTQASILTTYNAFSQAQASILAVGYGFSQAQASIKQIYYGFAQAQADILAVSYGFSQAQARILQVYNSFVQAQARILTSYNSFAQSQAKINAFGVNAFAQVLANIKGVDLEGVGQAQAKINAFDVNRFAQAQSQIKQTYNNFAQAQAQIKTTYNRYGQAQADILVMYNGYAQSQAQIKQTYNEYGQAQGKIKQTYNSFAQSQAQIKQTYNSFAQAQAQILGYSFGQAQAFIQTAFYGFAQAQAEIAAATHNRFAQAQAQIKVTTNQFAQAQASILQTYQSYAQAQANIRDTYEGFAQSEARIKQTYRGCGQAQASIKVTDDVFAQAQATVKQTYRGYGQAQARIKQVYFVCAQSQAYIKLIVIVSGQAQVWIEATYNASGQAQARILATVNQFAQAQGLIRTTEQGFGQAQSRIVQSVQIFAQAEGSIKQVYGRYAQAQANILDTTTQIANAQAWISITVIVNAQAQAVIASKYGFGLAAAYIRVAHTLKRLIASDRAALQIIARDRLYISITSGDRSIRSVGSDSSLEVTGNDRAIRIEPTDRGF